MPRIGSTALRILVLFLTAPAAVFAQTYASLDIQSLVNADITTYTNGHDYPGKGGPIKIDGVSFDLATIAPSSHTAVIQSSSAEGADQTFAIPINSKGITTVYTLINSAWGSCGTAIGELDFVSAKSGTYVYKLTEGENVRDHNNSHFCNSAPDIAGTANYGGGQVRLDMQRIPMPEWFADDTLVKILFKSYGQGYAGSPFIAAISLSPAPPCTITSETTATVPGIPNSRTRIGIGEVIALSSDFAAKWTIESGEGCLNLTPLESRNPGDCSLSPTQEENKVYLSARGIEGKTVVTATVDGKTSCSRTFTAVAPTGLAFERVRAVGYGFSSDYLAPDSDYELTMWSAVFVTPGDVSFQNVKFSEHDIPAPYSTPVYSPPLLANVGGADASLILCDYDHDPVRGAHMLGEPGLSKVFDWFYTYPGRPDTDFSKVETQITHADGGDYVYTKGQYSGRSENGVFVATPNASKATLKVPWDSKSMSILGLSYAGCGADIASQVQVVK